MTRIMLIMKNSGENIMLVDCNECKHISCTEWEQHQLKNLFGELPPHICHKYNKRVFHNHNTFALRAKNHSSYIYPCEECLRRLNDETI